MPHLMRFLGWICSCQQGKARNNLMILKIINDTGDEIWGLVEGLPNMGPFLMRDKIGMGVE